MSPAEQAIRLERIEGDMRLLTQRVSSAMENVTNTLGSVQVEVRGVSAKVSELALLQGSHDSNKTSIEKVEKSVSELKASLESWFDDFEQKQDRKWRDHEAENESSIREMEREIRSVRESLIRFVGFGSAVGTLASIVVGGFLWNLNYRFNDISADTTKDSIRIEALAMSNRQLIEQMGREHGSELADIKLYLARGGRIPEEPYTPRTQRPPDGQKK